MVGRKVRYPLPDSSVLVESSQRARTCRAYHLSALVGVSMTGGCRNLPARQTQSAKHKESQQVHDNIGVTQQLSDWAVYSPMPRGAARANGEKSYHDVHLNFRLFSPNRGPIGSLSSMSSKCKESVISLARNPLAEIGDSNARKTVRTP